MKQIIAALLLGLVFTTGVAAQTPSFAPVQYVLPYPGILPDHPLFNFKIWRDKLIELLISDPVRKAEFYLLQADKRLNMAVFLAGQGKETLAGKSLDQAAVYRRQMLDLLIGVKVSGKEIPDYVTERLLASLVKHKEIVGKLGSDQQKETVITLTDLAQQLK